VAVTGASASSIWASAAVLLFAEVSCGPG